MYNLNERLELIKSIGVIGIMVSKVPNERPLPGEKLAGGVELSVQNNAGFLAAFSPREKLTFVLSVETQRRKDIFVVWAEGRNRQIRALGDQTPGAETGNFSKRIPTDKTLSGDWVTKSTDNIGNGIWIISTAGGQLQMWEVAIVTVVTGGRANFYLSLQKVYAAEMFARKQSLDESNSSVFIPEEQFPGYAGWESLQEFIERAVNVASLGPVSEYKPAELEEKLLVAGQAEVVWFNLAKGFGFARVAGEINNPIFHRTSILNQQFPAFEPGQILTYSYFDRTPKGVQLRGVSEV